MSLSRNCLCSFISCIFLQSTLSQFFNNYFNILQTGMRVHPPCLHHPSLVHFVHELRMTGQKDIIERAKDGVLRSIGEGGLYLTYLIPKLHTMHFTYILESISKPGKRYIGHTTDLKRRIKEHNSGKCPHTTSLGPWKIKLYVAFETLSQAQKFERYLKSGSGHAFANKYFWS